MSMFTHVYSKVHNRGIPPQSFIEKLVDWAREADKEIFSEEYHGTEPDIYEDLHKHHPAMSGMDRRAVMCEVLRVLAGFESSWKWTEGRDWNNASSNTAATEEAGAFQCSANSVNFDKSLRYAFNRWAMAFRRSSWVNADVSGVNFIRMSKEQPEYAIEHAARLLRFTIRHNGPVDRAEIYPWMRVEAVEEFARALAPSDIGQADLTAGLAKLEDLLNE